MATVDSQQTIQNDITVTGKGLMLGEPVTLTLKPAPADSGVVFRRMDIPGTPEVKVCQENWADLLPRCTSLQSGDTTVSSVEHILSALGGLGVDNVLVELDASEAPGLDGSAAPYVEKIQAVGLVSQEVPRKFIDIQEPFALAAGDRQLILLPADALEVTFVYTHPQTNCQTATFKIDPDSYARDIAPARSFCFEDEIEALQALGIGKGASHENVLVVNAAGESRTPLRFEDEFVRHKILDLIGDLYLAGHLPKAHVIAMRTGHAFHAEFVRALAEAGHLQQTPAQEPIEVMDIYEVLPHRHPMCMVDRVIEYESKKRAVGIKNVTYNEPIFEGHFPTLPVMPGVLQIEALAQLAAWLVLRDIGKEGELGYFRSINKATFRRAVIPGDQLRLEIEVAQLRSRLARIEGRAYVEGQLATEVELSIVLASA